MKKFLIYILFAAAAISCSVKEDVAIEKTRYSIQADALAKIVVGPKESGSYPCLWSENDVIGLFRKSDNLCFCTSGILSGAGSPKGTFEFETEMQAGTQFRVFYPSDVTPGEGNLPASQTQTGENVSDLSIYDHAYSDILSLPENPASPIIFSLTHALPVVRVRLSSDIVGGITLKSVTLANETIPVAGDFIVDYSTGTVTPGQNKQMHTTLSFSKTNPVLTSDETSVWLLVLPNSTKSIYSLKMKVLCNSKEYDVVFKYNIALHSNSVMSLNATGITMENLMSGNAGSLDSETLRRDVDPFDPVDHEVYTYPAEISKSTRYSVSVEGEDATVLTTVLPKSDGTDFLKPNDKQPTSYDDPNVCAFGADKEVTVKVKFLEGAPSSVRVAPVSKGYKYYLSGDELTIKLKTYDQISVEVNNDLLHPLFIFVNPVEQSALYEALCDPETTVYRAGKVHTGGIKFSGNKKVYIQGGAVFKGYVSLKTETDGVTLSGCGVLDSREHPGSAIDLHYVNHASISNLLVINKKYWTVRLVGSDNLLVDNLHIISPCSFNDMWDENDAIHLLGCQNGTIKRTFGYSWDDVFNVGTTYSYQTELRLAREAMNVVVEDCIGWNVRPGNTFEIGWSMHADIHDITFRNSISIHSGTKTKKNHRSGMGIHNNGPATIHDLKYENIVLEDPSEFGIAVCILRENRVFGWGVGYVNNLTYTNVNMLKAPALGNKLQGYNTTHKVDNVTFNNLVIAGTKITSMTQFDSASDPSVNYTNVTFN